MTLVQKQQLFAQWTAKLIQKSLELGTPGVLGEAWRSDQTCALYAERGIGIKNSNHPNRLAIDLVLFRGDVYLRDTEDYRVIGGWWKSNSTPEVTFIWGGDFHDAHGSPKPDGNHFSFLHNGEK